MLNLFKNKRVLVIGGAGSIGSELVCQLSKYAKIVRVFDNNETGLFDLQHKLNKRNLRFLIGDVRDSDRLKVAMENIDYVFHAAALKHVHYSEYNPFETVKTNIIGTQNVINAAIATKVEKVISISSDKAVNPTNTMGATKLLTEKLIAAANYYKGTKKTIFSSVRFGNVLGSRGSVVPLFRKQIKDGGSLTLTSDEMTRFMMSIEQAVKLVLEATKYAKGGEIFVLKMPALRIKDLAEVLIEVFASKDIKIDIIGKKPGEKFYEELITEEELNRIVDLGKLFVILPNIFNKKHMKDFGYKDNYTLYKVNEEDYISGKAKMLDKEEIKKLLKID